MSQNTSVHVVQAALAEGAKGYVVKTQVSAGPACISSSNENMTRKSPTDKLLAPKNGVHTRQ